MPQVRVKKVVAHITKDNALLVFTHPYHPDAGIQVPQGTVEAGESSDEALVREVHEETGLDDLAVRSFLGTHEYDMSAHGRAEIQQRSYYHVELRGPAPAAWRHTDITGPHEFEFFWVPLPNGVPELAVGQGEFLSSLRLS